MPLSNSSKFPSRVIQKIIIALLFFCLSILSPLTLQTRQASAAETERSSVSSSFAASEKPPYVPVYRIPVRVHLGKSARKASDFRDILNEINDIWWLQAGICFEMEVVKHDKPIGDGIDIWFMPVLKESVRDNGYYSGDHMIFVRDTPILAPAAHPAHSPTARTTAHELGHALGLHHNQNSNDNLMRSKTYGWHLSKDEIEAARKAAPVKALPDINALHCKAPDFKFH